MPEFAILLHEKPIGKAEVVSQGLYHRIYCKLNLPRNTIYRVFVSDGEKKLDLGVCVPEGDCFCLNKNIPAKQLTLCAELKFYAECKAEKKQIHAYPVSSKEPFTELSNLMSAHFEMRDGTGYIVLS